VCVCVCVCVFEIERAQLFAFFVSAVMRGLVQILSGCVSCV